METKEIAMPPLPEEENTQVIEQSTEDNNKETIETAPQVVEEVKDNSKESNFRALREKQERLEREHQEALRKLQEYEKLKNVTQKEEEDLEINIGDDDLFEGKHYRKLQKQLKKQEEALKKYETQVHLTATEAKLKSQYNDFDKVVSEENIKRLRESEPELAETIANTPNIYNKAVSAYKMIKKLGIYIEDNYESDRNIAQKNSLKPKSAASVSPQKSESPLTQANAFANGLTPELKKQLWKEMNSYSKQY